MIWAILFVGFQILGTIPIATRARNWSVIEYVLGTYVTLTLAIYSALS